MPPHRLSAHGLVSFGSVESLRPRLAAEPGVRVSGCSTDDAGALYFRAEGGVRAAGVYRERRGEDAQLLAADAGAVLLEPRVAGGVVVMKRCAPAGAPSFVSEIVFAHEDGRSRVLAGQSVACSADGKIALVLDVPARTLKRVTLSTLEAQEVRVSGARPGWLASVDPQQAPLLALDAAGAEALCMDVDQPRGAALLYRVSLDDGALMPVLAPLAAPSWVCASFSPRGDGALALSCRYGDEPSTTLTFISAAGKTREVLRTPVTSPASLPAFLDDETALLPLSLTAHGAASYGPVQLVAVSLAGKAPVVAPYDGDLLGAARVLSTGEGARVVVVEGGHSLLRVAAR